MQIIIDLFSILTLRNPSVFLFSTSYWKEKLRNDVSSGRKVGKIKNEEWINATNTNYTVGVASVGLTSIILFYILPSLSQPLTECWMIIKNWYRRDVNLEKQQSTEMKEKKRKSFAFVFTRWVYKFGYPNLSFLFSFTSRMVSQSVKLITFDGWEINDRMLDFFSRFEKPRINLYLWDGFFFFFIISRFPYHFISLSFI